MIRRIGEGGGNNNNNVHDDDGLYDDNDEQRMSNLSLGLMFSRHRRQHKEVCMDLIL